MRLRFEDIEKAIKISVAIQNYLEDVNQDGLRSTDVYNMLARTGLVERDRHEGYQFRKFLHLLKDNNMLHLIPQCHCVSNNGRHNEWYFNRSKRKPSNKTAITNASQKHTPNKKIIEDQFQSVIAETKRQISELPKRDSSSFTPQMLELRLSYPRAYEFWTHKELNIMRNTFQKVKNIDLVAKILQRQPHVIRERLNI